MVSKMQISKPLPEGYRRLDVRQSVVLRHKEYNTLVRLNVAFTRKDVIVRGDHKHWYILRSVLTKKGVLQHFFTKQHWYADYQLTPFFKKQVQSLKDKGYVVISNAISKPITQKFNISDFVSRHACTFSEKPKRGMIVPRDLAAYRTVVEYKGIEYSCNNNYEHIHSDAEPLVAQLLEHIRGQWQFLPFMSTIGVSLEQKQIYLLKHLSFVHTNKPTYNFIWNLFDQAAQAHGFKMIKIIDNVVLAKSKDVVLCVDKMNSLHFIDWTSATLCYQRSCHQFFANINGKSEPILHFKHPDFQTYTGNFEVLLNMQHNKIQDFKISCCERSSDLSMLDVEPYKAPSPPVISPDEIGYGFGF